MIFSTEPVTFNRASVPFQLEILRTLALASIFPPNYAHPSQRSLLLRAICSLSSYPPRGSLHPLERISSFQQDTNDSEEPRKSILSLMVTLFCREADKAGERLDAYTKGLVSVSADFSDGRRRENEAYSHSLSLGSLPIIRI